MSNIRTKPATDNYRNWFDSTYGDRPLPKGGTKRYSLDDLKKERELENKPPKKKKNKNKNKKK